MSVEFGNRLREAREKKGLSQAEMAQKSGLQPSAVSHFESGRRAPSFDNLRKLADALSVTIDFLLGRESEPHSSGPTVQKLFRDFEKLSADDQETVAGFAEMLAAKNRQKGNGE
ncbi:MAG: helix-turn-helix transcriptional regulator [Planctomycetaceae bacterium]|nr:helix-turn-helix transcriptional regulator [Planctomycetaceae bacterium]